jgi:glucose dehydrogenase
VTADTTEVAVVGAGVCGLLVARELAAAGREVTILERGAWRPHAQQLRDGRHAGTGPGAQPNHEPAPGQRDYPWTYVYGVGGSTLAWAGVAPRFAPSDFTLRSDHSVGRDWPVSYDELAPFYHAAETALGVAGPDGADEPHPLSPVDTLLAEHLLPFRPLPQARPSRAIGGRPPCEGRAACELCPTDARYTGLHTLRDARLDERASVDLRAGTAVARLRTAAGRVTAIEAIRSDGTPVELAPRTVVLAANGLENAALLLRSGLDGPDVGRWLFDHAHRIVELELDRPAGNGYGATPATGISYAYAENPERATRGDVLVLPLTSGVHVGGELADALAGGLHGRALRAEVARRFERTLVLDTVGEDLPRADRFLELSPRRDALGLPLNRISYPPDSEYLERSHRVVADDLVRRLAPLGARLRRTLPHSGGAHSLGTCFMGESDGVVDPQLRHHRLENLYVAGGSAFPSYGAAHPTLTIAALAIRLGRHLAA